MATSGETIRSVDALIGVGLLCLENSVGGERDGFLVLEATTFGQHCNGRYGVGRAGLTPQCAPSSEEFCNPVGHKVSVYGVACNWNGKTFVRKNRSLSSP